MEKVITAILIILLFLGVFKVVELLNWVSNPKSYVSVEIKYVKSKVGKTHTVAGSQYMKSWQTWHVIEIGNNLEGKSKERVFFHEFGHVVQSSMLPGERSNLCNKEFFAESFSRYCMGYSLEDSYKIAYEYLENHPDIQFIDEETISFAKKLLEVVINDGMFIEIAKERFSKL